MGKYLEVVLTAASTSVDSLEDKNFHIIYFKNWWGIFLPPENVFGSHMQKYYSMIICELLIWFINLPIIYLGENCMETNQHMDSFCFYFSYNSNSIYLI